MPKLTRRAIERLLVSSILLTGPVCNFAADNSSAVEKQSYVVRANAPLSEEYLKRVMDVFDSRTLSKESYPDLAQLTSTQIISVFCGSYLPTYWDRVSAENNSIALPTDPDAVIGEIAYQVKWPACVYVDPKPEYTVRPGDTASGIYRVLTGKPGEFEAVNRYFEASDVENLNKLKPGQTLFPAYVTASTRVKTSLDLKEIRYNLNNHPGSSSVRFSLAPALALAPAPPQPIARRAPKLAIAAGKIQSASSVTYDSPTECMDPSAPSQPFDTTWLSNAYKDSLQGAKLLNLPQSEAKVTIADNGFFGANVIDGEIVFSPNFPQRFFKSVRTGGPGIIGPLTAGQTVQPINYLNKLTHASVISGHGTHIAGLVLGGAAFQSYLSVFDRQAGEPWLRLWIVNIGNGSDTLIQNSTAELSQKLNLLKNNIINLSLEYADPYGALDDAFLLLAASDNLFVVSAGNDGKKDLMDVPYYPASLGGTSQSNVIAVAAHKPNGELAAFSNRSARSVDLAAPGCNLSSWLDDSGIVTNVSGTSQSAAVVTFAAALLKSLDNMQPVEIKNRLMVSGDLLANSSSRTAPKSREILSRSKLNIARALYVFDDYVKYVSAEDGSTHEVLGELTGITDVSCDDELVDMQNLWALKASADGLWLYKGKTTPLLVIPPPCLASAEKGGELRIKVRAELNAEGDPVPLEGRPVRAVSVSKLTLLVTANRPLRP